MNLKEFRSSAEKQVIIRGMIQDPGANPEARKGAGTQVLVQAYTIFSGVTGFAGRVSYRTDFEQSDSLLHDMLRWTPVLLSSLPYTTDHWIKEDVLRQWAINRGPWCKPVQFVMAHEFYDGPVQKFGEYQGIPLCVFLNLARILEFLRGKIVSREFLNRADHAIAQDLHVRITGFLSERQKKISSAVNELSSLLS